MENSSFATNLQAGLRILLGVFSFVMAFLLIGPGTRFHVSFETEKGSAMSRQDFNIGPQPSDVSSTAPVVPSDVDSPNSVIPPKPTTEVSLPTASLHKGPSSPPTTFAKGPTSPASTSPVPTPPTDELK